MDENIDGWTQLVDKENRRRWKQDENNVFLTITHTTDHFARDGEDHAHPEYQQVMRWQGVVTEGETVTIGINKYEKCDESCESARESVEQWSEEFMKEHKTDSIEDLTN